MTNASRNRPSRLLASLALGLATTVLIGWAAMFLPHGRHGYGPPTTTPVGLAKSTDGFKVWEITQGRNAWHRVVSYWFVQISGQALMMRNEDFEARRVDLESLPRHLRPASLDDLHMQAWYREVGWPLKALTCSIHWKTQVRNADIIYRVEGGVQLPRDREFQPRAFPLTPIWTGLIADSAAFALAWLALFTAAGRLREARRRRAGCCVHCGYPRTGRPDGSRCPECGG